MIESSPIADRFKSCQLKLDRARKHIDDLFIIISDFWAADSCQLDPVNDGQDEVGRVRVSRVSPVPEIISLTAGDAAHNIRSALDHFAWAAVPPSARSIQTCFPIGSRRAANDQNGWHQQVRRQLNGAPPELVSTLESMEPWEGGRDEDLWAVHELDRVDKHRLVLSAAVALTRIELHGDSYELTTAKKFSGWSLDGPLPLEPIRWSPVKEDTILDIPLSGSDLGGTGTTLTFNIVLEEPQPLRTIAAATALMMLADSAEKAVRYLSVLA